MYPVFRDVHVKARIWPITDIWGKVTYMACHCWIWVKYAAKQNLQGDLLPAKPYSTLSHVLQLWPLQVPLFGICTMDPTFKVDLEPFYSCPSSSYLKDHLQWGPHGLVAPLLMGRMSAAEPSLSPLFSLFLSSFFSLSISSLLSLFFLFTIYSSFFRAILSIILLMFFSLCSTVLPIYPSTFPIRAASLSLSYLIQATSQYHSLTKYSRKNSCHWCQY